MVKYWSFYLINIIEIKENLVKIQAQKQPVFSFKEHHIYQCSNLIIKRTIIINQRKFLAYSQSCYKIRILFALSQLKYFPL